MKAIKKQTVEEFLAQGGQVQSLPDGPTFADVNGPHIMMGSRCREKLKKRQNPHAAVRGF